MKTFNKLSAYGAAFLVITSMGSVYAQEGDVTQAHTQERTRTEFNQLVPNSDFEKSQSREENRVMNKNQNQHKYQYMKNMQKRKASSGQGDMAGRNEGRLSTTNRSTGGGNGGRR